MYYQYDHKYYRFQFDEGYYAFYLSSHDDPIEYAKRFALEKGWNVDSMKRVPYNNLINGTLPNIMAFSDVDDMSKLMYVFEQNKDSIRDFNPDLFYALLAVKDNLKSGYKFVKDN